MKRSMTALGILAAMTMPVPALAATDGVPDWVYGDGELPEKWSITNESYATCDAGMMQSPINLDQANASADVDFAAAYGMAKGKLKLGPAKVQVDIDPGMGMISGDSLFSLLQFHFHTPAEHVMDGERYPLVVHLVHATSDGRFGVLGVMFEEGEANPALSSILKAAKAGKASMDMDVSAMIPESFSVYRYMGSLTTPPCTEGVNWHVADEVLTASKAQIAAMQEYLGTSNRSLQPVNNRLIVAPEG